MRRILAAAAIAIGLTLGGCSTVANLATQWSSSTPLEVRTYAQATQAATLVTNAVDVAVRSDKLDQATLGELDALNEGVHAAWVRLKAANDAGHSLSFASFNAALDAFNAYATTKGVQH